MARAMRIAILGGGPAGSGCALGLLRGARESGAPVEVTILEPKRFGKHYNQCLGVLTPKRVAAVLEGWGLRVPTELVQRCIDTYVLHAEENEIALQGGVDAPVSLALRRVEFDGMIQMQAVMDGAQLRQDRVTDVEFPPGEVTVYTEGGTCHADYLVAAFGLDPGAAAILGRATRYRPPPCVETVVTKTHPAGLAYVEDLLDNRIHAFIPRLPRVEFGALVPKGNHVSIVAAGKGITRADLQAFLRLPQVAALLPEGADTGETYRGAFPAGLARGLYGDRYLVVGDASGFVRPLKGGGIHAALLTGARAAESLLAHGPGREAGRAYSRACRDLRRDMPYGRFLRFLLRVLTGPFRLEPIIEVARRDEALRQILYGCVSGTDRYVDLLRAHLRLGTVLRSAAAVLGCRIGVQDRSSPSNNPGW